MDKKRKIILWVVLILGIVSIFGLIYYGRILREPKEQIEKLPSVAVQKRAATNPFGIEIPEQVRYYTGVIQEKSKGFLIINVLANDNFLTNDQELKVYINQDTRLLKYKMPSVYLKPGQNPKDFATGHGKTSLSDFKVGDRVTVYAKENIKGKSEFTAAEIRAVEYGN